MACTARQQPRPLNKEQVGALVRDGLADESGARLVKDRGLDFAPDQDFAESLRNAGANDAFINAVLAADHPRPAPLPKKALNRVQLTAMVKAGIASSRVAILVGERGIDFAPTDDYLQQLRTAGAGQDIVDSLKTAEAASPHPAQPKGTSHAPNTNAKVRRIREGGPPIRTRNLVYQERPEYPPLAKMAHIQGIVRMEVVIGRDGTVQDIKVLSGHPLLIEPALEAVSRWRYQPTLLNAEPVEVVTEVNINFQLDQ
jgi:protein TonB